jgi:hypothetical protein
VLSDSGSVRNSASDRERVGKESNSFEFFSLELEFEFGFDLEFEFEFWNLESGIWNLRSAMSSLSTNIRTTLEMIKIEHTLFALPFALAGRGAGGARSSVRLADRLDYGRDGRRSLDGDGLQSHRR